MVVRVLAFLSSVGVGVVGYPFDNVVVHSRAPVPFGGVCC